MSEQGKTLTELNVKPGDVVAWRGGSHRTVGEWNGKSWDIKGNDYATFCMSSKRFTIVSRAEPTEDTPKTWGEWEPVQEYEVVFPVGGTDYQCQMIGGKMERRIRIKPSPVRETVTMDGFTHNNEWFFRERDARRTHTITFDTIDGKPDCSSIVMEAIGDD